jgi:hypothetical protein
VAPGSKLGLVGEIKSVRAESVVAALQGDGIAITLRMSSISIPLQKARFRC